MFKYAARLENLWSKIVNQGKNQHAAHVLVFETFLSGLDAWVFKVFVYWFSEWLLRTYYVSVFTLVARIKLRLNLVTALRTAAIWWGCHMWKQTNKHVVTMWYGWCGNNTLFRVVEWDEFFSLQSPDTESRNHSNEERLRSQILCVMKLEIQRHLCFQIYLCLIQQIPELS